MADEALHGHPDFAKIAARLVRLHSDKNHDYAEAGDTLGNFHRVARWLSLYPGLNPASPLVVLLMYQAKHLDAILHQLAQNKVPKVDDLEDRFGDMAVYNILAMCELHDAGK